jgi:hypothetical protein
MKKTLALIFAVAVMASCKKVSPTQEIALIQSIDQQVADLIREGDPELYQALYTENSNRHEEPTSVKITRGIFNFGGGVPEDGTCLPDPNCVCHITCEWPALIDPTNPPEEEYLTDDYHGSYNEKGQAELIIRTVHGPLTVKDLASVDIVFDNTGASTLHYSILE